MSLFDEVILHQDLGVESKKVLKFLNYSGTSL